MKAKMKIIALLTLALISVPVLAEPKYTYSMERRDEALGKYMLSRQWATIERNGGWWELGLPISDWEAKNFDDPDFSETEDGFSLGFSWGGGVCLWYEIFFFKEIGGEPCLYEIESRLTSYNDSANEYGTETETRAVAPPIKISELTTKKIINLLGRRKIEGEIEQ